MVNVHSARGKTQMKLAGSQVTLTANDTFKKGGIAASMWVFWENNPGSRASMRRKTS